VHLECKLLAVDIDDWIATRRPGPFNSIYSPASVYTILAGVYLGISENSKTRLELQENFNFEPDFNADYINCLAKIAENKALDVFNSYVFHKSSLMPDYQKDIEILKFKKQQFATFSGKEDFLNNLVRKDTKGMIQKFLKPGSLGSNVELFLMNTILFNGKWEDAFKTTRTMTNWRYGGNYYDADFMISGDRYIQMYQSYSRGQLLYVSLKFKPKGGEQLWMTIIMPKDQSNVPVQNVHFKNINWSSMNKRKLRLIFPKFKIENDHNLVEFMKFKNSTRLFSSGTSDLDRMFEPNNGVYIYDFAQKAMIEVNEKGAKAAAVTYMSGGRKSGPSYVTINRPFKFFIHDDSKNLFFSGLVNCPSDNCK